MIFELFGKSGILLAAALCANLLLRKKSADLRRFVLSTAITVLFIAAAGTPLLPTWTFERPAPAVAIIQSYAPPILDMEPQFTPPQLVARVTPPQPIDFAPWLLPAIWFAGSAALLLRFAINLYRLRRLRKTSTPLSRLIRRNECIASPITWGIFRPVILVPANFEEMSREHRDAILCHELAHIQSRDFLMRTLAEVARALIWFQPLIWIVRRQLHEEQELACDNRVIASGGKPSTYAKLLLDWDTHPDARALVAAGIAHRSCLKRRLYALLDPDLRRDKVARVTATATVVLALATALPLAALSVTQAIAPRAGRSLQPVPSVSSTKPIVQIAQAQPAPTPKATPAPAAKLKFDVVSIKPCRAGDGPGRSGQGDMGANNGVNPGMPEGVGGYFRASPGRLDVTCGSLLTMISFAYIEHGSRLLNNPGTPMDEPMKIKGAPKWAMPARYTIHAESDDPDANGPTDPVRGQGPSASAELLYGPLLQSLLEDRFRLRISRVTDDAAMYALTVATGGPKLKPLGDGDCIPGGRPDWPDGAKPPCNWVGWPVHGPNRMLLGGGINMDRFAQALAMFVAGRNVINRTGIQGSYLIRLEYTPDENTAPCFGPPEYCTVDPNSGIPRAGTIFTALEQQFGLKLESIKGQQEHLQIDHVEQPAEN